MIHLKRALANYKPSDSQRIIFYLAAVVNIFYNHADLSEV
jgi:hypothetical protein